ncbi:hypothetical protein GLOTRDRAFT_127244 [Gloeophyllum trabeum ATCC 11539]|uniref:DUF6593 domain-containing protein n=1 Tax=Gloeophyllum trabeum (strain ATCC 11539 / FP-39264 / Madison 617) TaxID=670483 RepID=S7RUH2_GLOTA|nr:uncharacterized protein GLOTRDRAFT_127244 [Gloeophyllum trabeum ATCC 11539]EPQ56849.1 hypothetical protein GLOTRDRAFT_127244 [Gloeophyllum trabeum ATCC 11539]
MPPPPKPAPPYRLTFTCNSLRNTTVSIDNDTIYYEIVTRFWHPDVTKIFRLDKESRAMNLVARIKGVENKEKGVWVRFGREPGDGLARGPEEEKQREEGGEGEWIREEDFINYEHEKVAGTFPAVPGEELRWKTHRRRLQMIKPGDPEKPVANFKPHKRHFWVFRMSKHAVLELRPEVIQPEGSKEKDLEAMDRIIVSYLLVERRRRLAQLKLQLK